MHFIFIIDLPITFTKKCKNGWPSSLTRSSYTYKKFQIQAFYCIVRPEKCQNAKNDVISHPSGYLNLMHQLSRMLTNTYCVRNIIKYATVKQITMHVTRELYATKHHVFWISRISWSLEVNGLGNGSNKHGKASHSKQNAYSKVQPVRKTKVIVIRQWHVVWTKAVTGEYCNTGHVQQTYKEYKIAHIYFILYIYTNILDNVCKKREICMQTHTKNPTYIRIRM